MLNIFVLFNIDALSKPRVEIAPPNLPPCAQYYDAKVVDYLWFECINHSYILPREKDPFWASTRKEYEKRMDLLTRCVNKYKRENLPNRKCRNLNQRLFQKSSYYKQNFLIQTFVFENCMDDVDMKFCQSCLTKMIIADNKGDKTQCTHCNNNNLTHEEMLEKQMLPVWRDKDGTVHYDVPEELKDLRFGEQIMIQRFSPYIALKHIRSGSFGLKGHSCCFAQDIDEVCDVLPRKKEHLIQVIKQFRTVNENDNDDPEYSTFVIRRDKVLNALKWLKAHNSEYENINISTENLNWMEGCAEKSILEPHELNDDNSEDDNNEEDSMEWEETVAKNQTNTTSCNNIETFGIISEEQAGVCKDSEEIMDELRKTPSKKLGKMDFPYVETKAVSEYQGKKIFTNVYPWLFPGGEGDVYNDYCSNHISEGHGWVWASKLLGYRDGRFMKDKTFIFYALDMIQRHHCNNSGKWFMENYLNEKIDSLEELKEKIRNGQTSFVHKIQNYATKITGSDAYWRLKRDELYAWIEHHICQGHGAPNLFITLSCAENWWSENALQVSNIIRQTDDKLADAILDPNNMKARSKAMIDYAPIVQEMFQIRTKKWLETVGKHIFKIKHYWVRYEFAKGRGQIHAHLLAITSDGVLLNHKISESNEQEKVKIVSSYARDILGLTANFPTISDNSHADQLSTDDKQKIAKPEGTASKEDFMQSLKRRLSCCHNLKEDFAKCINSTEMHVFNEFCMRINKYKKV